MTLDCYCTTVFNTSYISVESTLMKRRTLPGRFDLTDPTSLILDQKLKIDLGSPTPCHIIFQTVSSDTVSVFPVRVTRVISF